MKTKIFNYYSIFFLLLVFPLCIHAESSKLNLPNTTAMTKLTTSQQNYIELPYTDEQCFITVTNLKVDEPKKGFLRLRGILRIDRDLNGKQVVIHDLNNVPNFHSTVCFENEPKKPLKTGEYRSFTAFTYTDKKFPKFEFFVRDSIEYAYQCPYNAEHHPLDFLEGNNKYVHSNVEVKDNLWCSRLAVNVNYPFVVGVYVSSSCDEDIILTKPLKIKINILEYDTKTGQERFIATRDLPTLDGYLPKNRRMHLSASWDYKDMKGNPVPMDKFYKVDFVLPAYEYKLLNSDKVIKVPECDSSIKMEDYVYYFSSK